MYFSFSLFANQRERKYMIKNQILTKNIFLPLQGGGRSCARKACYKSGEGVYPVRVALLRINIQ